MTVLQALLGFAAIAAVLTIIPGLDTTLVVRNALTSGKAQAFATGFGVCLGVLVWGAAAALGAAALLAASETAYLVIKFAGIGYMVYLGVAMIWRTFHGRPATDSALPVAPKSLGPARAFVQGLTTNILNPKIGVFYIAAIPQFVPEGTSSLAMGFALAAVHTVFSLVWFTTVIFAASSVRRWLAKPKALRVVDRVAGTFMIAFATRLAFQRS